MVDAEPRRPVERRRGVEPPGLACAVVTWTDVYRAERDGLVRLAYLMTGSQAVADGQEGSLDGGRTWSTLEPGIGGAAGGSLFGYVGFTTATQGVAVSYKPVPALFMTRDGGHSWARVAF